MAVHTEEFQLITEGHTDLIDITDEVQAIVGRSGVRQGLAVVANPGSTGAVTTIEYEPGAIADFRSALERLVPAEGLYEHDRAWGDGNGYAHVRSALVGPTFALPVLDGRALLGTWQQLVFVDFDNRPRQRRLLVVVQGDS